MMYAFRCTKCGNTEEKSIAINDYDKEKNNQTCSKCGSKMERVLEFDGTIGLCNGMFGVSAGGWNS